MKKEILIGSLFLALFMMFCSSCAAKSTSSCAEAPSVATTLSAELPVSQTEQTTDQQAVTVPSTVSTEDISALATEATTAPVNIDVEETTAEPIPLNVPAGTISHRYTSEVLGDYLDYLVHIPQNASENMPLVIFLHGDGQVGNINVLRWFFLPAKAREIYGEEFPFIVLTPCTRTESWIDGRIPGTLMELIDSVVETYKIDRDRIIISGHSRGAIGVWYLINSYGGYFSAAVPVSCESDVELNGEVCAQVPVWAFVGDSDKNEWDLLPLMQEHVDLINSSGGAASLTVIPGALHTETSSEAYTKETFEWMLSQ